MLLHIDNVAEVSYTAHSGSSGGHAEDSDDSDRDRREPGKRSVWSATRHAVRRAGGSDGGAHQNPDAFRMVSYGARASIRPTLVCQRGRLLGDGTLSEVPAYSAADIGAEFCPDSMSI